MICAICAVIGVWKDDLCHLCRETCLESRRMIFSACAVELASGKMICAICAVELVSGRLTCAICPVQLASAKVICAICAVEVACGRMDYAILCRGACLCGRVCALWHEAYVYKDDIPICALERMCVRTCCGSCV